MEALSVNIRIAELDDIDNLVKARFDYFAAEKWDVSFEQHEVIEKNLREYYSKHLNNDFFVALVEVDNEIASIAFLAVSAKPANLSFPTGKTGTVLNVLTYPNYRKKGYATMSMNLLIEIAKAQSLSYVELSASESGKSLYQRLGFKEKEASEHFIGMKLSLM